MAAAAEAVAALLNNDAGDAAAGAGEGEGILFVVRPSEHTCDLCA